MPGTTAMLWAAAVLAQSPATTPDDPMTRVMQELEALRQQNAALAEGLDAMRRENKTLQGSVAELQAQQNEKWLSKEREAEVRQTVAEMLKDSETRSALRDGSATSGYVYDRGFYIATPDGNFRLNLSGQLQIRYAASFYSNRDNDIINANTGAGVNRGTGAAPPPGSYLKNVSGFEIRRMKLDFYGHMIDPSWQYRVMLIYNQNQNALLTPGGNNAAGVAGSSNMGMEEAMVIKDLGEGWKISVGQFKSPFLQEEIVSSRRQLAVERSLVDQMFSTKFTQGAMLTWQNEQLIAEVMYNDGGSNANTGASAGFNNALFTDGTTTLNNGAGFAQWAVTGHLGWVVFGEWSGFRDMNNFRGESEGLLLNAWMNMQRGGQHQSPTVIGTNNIPLNGNADAEFLSWSVDATWNLGGANLFTYFVMNTAYSMPSTPTNDLGSINSYGAVVQGGYFITDEVELYARWEWMNTQNRGVNDIGIANTGGNSTYANVFNAGRTNAYTVGFNWFLGGRIIKLTTDLGWTSDPLWFNNGIYGAGVLGTNYRIEPGGGGNQMVVRSQLQILF